MRQLVVVILLVSGILLGFMGYCVALIDWIIDVRTGIYTQNHVEALWETAALVFYTWLGVRFVLRRVNPF